MSFISIIIESNKDYEVAAQASRILREFGVEFELIVASLKLNKCLEYIEQANQNGVGVFICIGQNPEILSQFVLANSKKPILSVKVLEDYENISNVTFPFGVSNLGFGKRGARNAAYFAIKILAVCDKALENKLEEEEEKRYKILDEESKKIEVLLKDKP